MRWNLYRFDYGRYVMLRPTLRAATEASGLTRLAIDERTRAIRDSCADGATSIEEARQSMVRAFCCLGEPLVIGPGLSRYLGDLAARDRPGQAVELLVSLFNEARHVEAWLKPAPGLAGFLTPDEAVIVQQKLPDLRFHDRVLRRGLRRRRETLASSVGIFCRLLLDRSPGVAVDLGVVSDLVDEAVVRDEGVAAVAC